MQIHLILRMFTAVIFCLILRASSLPLNSPNDCDCSNTSPSNGIENQRNEECHCDGAEIKDTDEEGNPKIEGAKEPSDESKEENIVDSMLNINKESIGKKGDSSDGKEDKVKDAEDDKEDKSEEDVDKEDKVKDGENDKEDKIKDGENDKEEMAKEGDKEGKNESKNSDEDEDKVDKADNKKGKDDKEEELEDKDDKEKMPKDNEENKEMKENKNKDEGNVESEDNLKQDETEPSSPDVKDKKFSLAEEVGEIIKSITDIAVTATKKIYSHYSS